MTHASTHALLADRREKQSHLELMRGSSFNMLVWIVLFAILRWTPLLDFLTLGTVISVAIHILWFTICIMEEA